MEVRNVIEKIIREDVRSDIHGDLYGVDHAADAIMTYVGQSHDEIERLRQQNAELMEEINKLKQAKEINKYDTHYPDDGFGGYPSVYNRR